VQEFRERIFAKHGDNPHNRQFVKQCVFMGEIVQALGGSGYRVTVARTYGDAAKRISDGEFDLAIIDLNWAMDLSIPEGKRENAGWRLCDLLDDKDKQAGKRTPQILFSSRFPKEPELSREAARRQKLPMFKEATETVRNSLMAFVGFVDATLAAQRSASSTSSSPFDEELDRRTHLTNHHNRNACGLNGRQDRVRSVWRDGDQQRARRNQFQRIERERTANRVGFAKHGNVLANDPKPETGKPHQLEEPHREPAFRRIVHRVHDLADISSRESRTHDTDAGLNQETSGPRQKIDINPSPQLFGLLSCEDRGALDGHTACQ
jgi:CheY-like chemotaxis protein